MALAGLENSIVEEELSSVHIEGVSEGKEAALELSVMVLSGSWTRAAFLLLFS